MNKKAWAKGRKKQILLAVDEQSREIARQLAEKEGVKIKDLIFIALLEYSAKIGHMLKFDKSLS